MAKDKAQIGHNMTSLKDKISEGIQSVKRLKSERKETNEAIAEVRARMEALGIHKAAFDMAMRYLEWEPEKRENFDLAYALVREAGGLPMVDDLFAAAERKQREHEETQKEVAKKTDADALFAKRADAGKKKTDEEAAEKPFADLSTVGEE